MKLKLLVDLLGQDWGSGGGRELVSNHLEPDRGRPACGRSEDAFSMRQVMQTQARKLLRTLQARIPKLSTNL